MSERVKIGTIDVDSGTVFVGDPCYTITDDASHRIKTWREWCERTGGMFDADSNGVSEPAGKGIGLTFGTAYGDGSYPVYAEYENGRITSVTIEFDDEEEN